jgi:hypothetical protein
LAKLSDKDLALWQSKYPQDSPQFILGQFEWNRRLTAEQVMATLHSARWSAWFGIAGVVIGLLLGKLLERVLKMASGT